MERLTLRTELSPEGRDFLIAALDPMHDNQLKDLVGWPDLETAPSVVRCIKQSVPIAAGPDSGAFDVHVVVYPWLQNQIMADAALRTNNYFELNNIGSPATTTFSIGGVSIYVVPTGTVLDISSSEVTQQLIINPSYTAGASRVIGMGLEVLNTSAQLYKSGQVFTWRMPQPRMEPNNFLLLGNVSGRPLLPNSMIRFDGQVYDCPPQDSSQALLIPGTRQWEASDGTYFVIPHIGQDNPPLAVDYLQPMIFKTPNVDIAYTQVNGSVLPNVLNTNIDPICFPVPLVNSTTNVAFPAQRIYPVHMCGTIFQGLAQGSTLNLTWNVYLETFPTVAQPEILVLATPSACYDPVALQLYSNALTKLPVGVPADWNGFGDWFADVVSTISDFLTPGAMAMGMPAVAAVSAGAGRIAKNYLASNSANTKPETRAAARKKVLATQPNYQAELAASRRLMATAARTTNTRRAPRKKPVSQKQKAADIAAILRA